MKIKNPIQYCTDPEVLFIAIAHETEIPDGQEEQMFNEIGEKISYLLDKYCIEYEDNYFILPDNEDYFPEESLIDVVRILTDIIQCKLDDIDDFSMASLFLLEWYESDDLENLYTKNDLIRFVDKYTKIARYGRLEEDASELLEVLNQERKKRKVVTIKF